MDGSLRQTVIAVSGLHRGESPQPGGAVIECIRAFMPDVRVVGISFDLLESGLFTRGPDRVDTAYLFPYPGAGASNLLSRIREVHAREGLSLILPTLDAELEPLSEIADDLGEMGIKVILPDHRGLVARSKLHLSILAAEAGLEVPQTLAANTAPALAQMALQIGYPCYVKGALYDAHLVHDAAELTVAFNKIHAVWGGPVLVQKACIGEEYDVAAVGDGEGGIVGALAIRKLLRSRMGKAFGGVVVDDPDINDIAARLVRTLKWRGPLEVEIIKPAGRPHVLFEINPRFPAWISFAAKAGVNLPAWVAAKALGRPLPTFDTCPPGKLFFRHATDIVADITDIANLSIDHETGGLHVIETLFAGGTFND